MSAEAPSVVLDPAIAPTAPVDPVTTLEVTDEDLVNLTSVVILSSAFFLWLGRPITVFPLLNDTGNAIY